MKRKQGKPTARELQTLGISTKYGGQRFPPGEPSRARPKPGSAKRKKKAG